MCCVGFSQDTTSTAMQDFILRDDSQTLYDVPYNMWDVTYMWVIQCNLLSVYGVTDYFNSDYSKIW